MRKGRNGKTEKNTHTHIARRKRRVHGAPRVGFRRQPARVVERRGLAVVDGGPELHALVVPAADERAGGGDESGADLGFCGQSRAWKWIVYGVGSS